MKTIVFAYHNMGLAGIEALQHAGYQIDAIFSHEDDPAERCWFGSVQAWGKSRGIPVHCPAEVNCPAWIEWMASLAPEMIFSFYYRRMLSDAVLQLPSRGAFNLHGSLLPAYRGRCPVNWVLIHGETRTGVTLHHMVRQADAGDIVGQREVLIEPEETARSLYDKLCVAAAVLLDDLLPLLRTGNAPRYPQDISLGSYYSGRRPEDGRIRWHDPAQKVFNLIRAVTDPYPGAFGILDDGTQLKVWWGRPREATIVGAPLFPGQIGIADGEVFVGTGKGHIQLLDVEIPTVGRMSGMSLKDYFKGKEGMILR